jgi:hypothetical protein
MESKLLIPKKIKDINGIKNVRDLEKHIILWASISMFQMINKGPSQISRNYLMEKFGNKYKRLIKNLEDNQLIFVNNKYSVENKICKKYEINTHISEYEIYDIKTNFIRQEFFMKFSNGVSYNKWLWTSLKSTSFNSDIQSHIEKFNFISEHSKWCTSFNIENIKSNALFLKRDNNNGRVYSNICFLKREFRKHLLIDKEETVEIDVVNSQPTLLASFFNKIEETAEYSLFLETVKNGCFYETIAKLVKNSCDLDRKQIKEQVYKCILFNVCEKSEWWKSFNSLFPTLAECISKLSGSELAIKLQTIESKIMIDSVCSNLEKLNIKCLTVHDSVIVKKKDESQVVSIIKECFFKELSFYPSISAK